MGNDNNSQSSIHHSPLKNGYKKTEIGVIPEDWELETIDNTFSFSGGSQPVRDTFIFIPKKGYIRLLQIRDYKTNKYASYIPIKLANKFCTKDDIMIGRYGPPIFQILNGLEGAYNVALLKAIPNNKLDKRFGLYFLKQTKLFDFVEKLSQRSSGQTGVDLVELKKYLYPLPPLPEQKAIAEVLSDTDELIQTLEKQIAKKRLIKQGAMQVLLSPPATTQMMNGELSIVNEKEKWEVKKLGEIAEIKKGEQLNRDTLQKNNVYPVINGGIIPSGYTNIWNKKADTITISEGGNSCGFVNFIKTKFWQGGHCYSIETRYNQMYLYHFLKYSEKIIMSLRVGSGLPNIQRNRLSSFCINLPKSQTEQTRIATILSDMDSEIETLENKLAKYKKIKQGMMQELLTGKIRLMVNDK